MCEIHIYYPHNNRTDLYKGNIKVVIEATSGVLRLLEEEKLIFACSLSLVSIKIVKQ